eukprot:10850607-Karenia_brevis.AAC.1
MNGHNLTFFAMCSTFILPTNEEDMLVMGSQRKRMVMVRDDVGDGEAPAFQPELSEIDRAGLA